MSAADVNTRMVFVLPLCCPDVKAGLLMNAKPRIAAAPLFSMAHVAGICRC
jgi:hypothetical protein